MIPCETIVRLSNVMPRPGVEISPIFYYLRIENGLVIATDRKFMAIEHVGGNSGVIHMQLTPTLLAQCKVEAPLSSKLTLDPTTGTVRTTMGYAETVPVYAAPCDFDRWRGIVADAARECKASVGAMFWSLDDVARLASTSPSGQVVFPKFIDTGRPMLLRDVNSADWLGVFHPVSNEGLMHAPATLPSWCAV